MFKILKFADVIEGQKKGQIKFLTEISSRALKKKRIFANMVSFHDLRWFF